MLKPYNPSTRLQEDRQCEYCGKLFNCGSYPTKTHCSRECRQNQYVFRKTGHRPLSRAQVDRAALSFFHINDFHNIHFGPSGNIGPFWIFFLSALLGLITLSFASCEPAHAAEGFASYYTIKSCQAEGTSGVFTASGERYDESAMTCALRRRDFGKSYLVYGHNTGKSVVVRHSDYGPGKGPTRKGVVIDLTPVAFSQVCGDLKMGKCLVSVQEIKGA